MRRGLVIVVIAAASANKACGEHADEEKTMKPVNAHTMHGHARAPSAAHGAKASFHPRLIASWMPVFIPCPPAGDQAWAASPAR